MRRRELIIALGFAMAWPIAANGQQDARALRSQILLMQAECIADKLAEFIKQAQNQVGWTTQLPSTGGSIEQRQFDALRLLQQAPAITELSLLDAEGKEFYRVSRLAMDVVGSGEIHGDGGQEDLLRAGLFASRVGALHDFGAGRCATRRWRDRRRTQSQRSSGNCATDQGRQSRRRLCC
jgi:hypothetical protein